jgi:hypothetical protein
MKKPTECTNWREESLDRERERLRDQSALNRLGQGNYNGIKRSPVRQGPDPRPEDRRSERW